MQTEKVSGEPNFYLLLVPGLSLNVCACVFVCGRWGVKWKVSGSEGEPNIEAEERTAGFGMKIAFIFLFYLHSLNNSINFISVNIIDIPHLPLTLVPPAPKHVPKHYRSHLWREALNSAPWHFVLGV